MDDFTTCKSIIKIKSNNQDNIINFLDLLHKENKFIKLIGKAEKSITQSYYDNSKVYMFSCDIKLKNSINFAFASINSKKVNIKTLESLTKNYDLRLLIYCKHPINDLQQLYEVCQGNYIQWREWRDDSDLLKNDIKISYDDFT